MTDSGRRGRLVRDGAAALALEGVVAADRYVAPAPMTVKTGAAPLRAAPDAEAEQTDQLLFGEGFDLLAAERSWGFGQACRDGYVGWVELEHLGPRAPSPTHRVAALGSAVLIAPDARAPARMTLPLNALVRVGAGQGRFAQVEAAGWVAAAHLSPIGLFETDPVAVAERHLGVPYLWGGRGPIGIDCSGLVQQALLACGRGCPRDSDQQAALGSPVAADELRRGDLVCWTGHIGLMVDARRLVHASGVQMAVVVEPLADAVAARMEAVGPPTARRRLERG